MILYNILITVEEGIEEEWLEWMTTKHIPNVMDTKCFFKSKVYRIVSPEPEDGVQYNIQYFANDIEDYEKYQIEHAAILQSAHKEKYEGKFTAYRTVMEEI
jgi:hypothetical protein